MTPESQQAALKPCPFCSHNDAIVRSNMHEAVWVLCRSCGASSSRYRSKERATEAWNLRAHPAGGVSDAKRECAEFSNQVFYLARAMYQQFCADHYETMDHEPEDWKYMSHLHRHPWLRKAKAISDRIAASPGKERGGVRWKRRKPKTFNDVYCGPEVCDCGAILGVEEWTCAACGRDPLDESEPEYDNGDDE